LLLIRTLIVASLVSCSPEPSVPVDSGPACTLPFIGDKTKPIEMTLTVREASGKSVALKEGADVPLIFPPQGGRVVFLGARVNNVDPCAVKLSGAIRDVATNQVRVDNRTVNLIAGADGWGGGVDEDISTFSNVPMCPNQWASTDAFDKPFRVEVTVTDKSGRTVMKQAMVTPRCAEPANAAECLCICKKGYVLGEVCMTTTDAGSDG
jgi:hypothetical protein